MLSHRNLSYKNLSLKNLDVGNSSALHEMRHHTKIFHTKIVKLMYDSIYIQPYARPKLMYDENLFRFIIRLKTYVHKSYVQFKLMYD